MLRLGRYLGLALLFWASLGVAQDFQFKPAVSMADVTEKTLTDISRAGNRLVAVGERGLVIYSDDDGASWTQADVPVSATLTAVDFPTPELGWAVGHAGTIIHSADGGTSWSLQFDGNEANRQWLAKVTRQREALEARVQALQDAGATAEPDGEDGEPGKSLADLEYDLEDAIFNEEDAQGAIETGPADPMLDVMFTSASKGWAVGAYGMIYHTTNAGTDWQLA
ncbi:MAG: YCF48-related protein, partial [Halioglobus sp.]|nr:YCF48-related protein [Halioglobus sp.]